jgi:hypothetical protein
MVSVWWLLDSVLVLFKIFLKYKTLLTTIFNVVLEYCIGVEVVLLQYMYYGLYTLHTIYSYIYKMTIAILVQGTLYRSRSTYELLPPYNEDYLTVYYQSTPALFIMIGI